MIFGQTHEQTIFVDNIILALMNDGRDYIGTNECCCLDLFVIDYYQVSMSVIVLEVIWNDFNYGIFTISMFS